MLYVILLVVIALVSVSSFGKYINRCEKVDFSTIMNKEYAFVDNDTTTDFTLIFSDDGRVLGSSKMNKYFSAYKLDENNQINFSSIGTTMNSAPDEEIIAERKYIEMLSNVSKVKVCKDKLLLIDGEKTLNFIPTGKEITEVITDVEKKQNTKSTEEDKPADVNQNTTNNETSSDNQVVEPENTEETNNVAPATENTQ